MLIDKMSQAADLEHLFKLEQILSLRSTERERCDKYETLEGTPLESEINNVKGLKLSTSDLITNEAHICTTTSFDPGGGKVQSSSTQEGNKEGGGNAHQKNEGSEEIDLNKPLSTSINTTNSVSSLSNTEKEEILSYAASSCGRALVFIAFTGNGTNSYPQLGSVVLKPVLQCSSLESEVAKNERNFGDLTDCNVGTNIQASAYFVSWFDHGDGASDALTCVTLREHDNLCLVSCRDGSLYLLPADIIFPEFHENIDFKGTSNINDCFSQLSSENVAKIPFEIFAIPTPLYHRRCNPTALIFWTTTELNVAIVGTRSGRIVAVNLYNGKEVGCTHPSNSAILRFEIMKDETLDSTFLFITDAEWNQWRMLLERRTSGYTWCENPVSDHQNGEYGNINQIFKPECDKQAKLKMQESGNKMGTSRESMLNEGDSERESCLEVGSLAKRSDGQNDEITGGRTRLAGFKQLSFASLANIRQKINEGRRLLASSSTRVIGSSNDLSNSGLSNSRGSISHGGYKIEPEALNCKVGGTRLSVQQTSSTRNIRGQGNDEIGSGSMVLGGLYPETAILTLHNIELEVLPQVAFKLPRYSEQVLVLNKLMVVAGKELMSGRLDNKETKARPSQKDISSPPENANRIFDKCEYSPGSSDKNSNVLRIVSSHHSEIHLDTSRSKEEPVLQSFHLPTSERILGIERTSYRYLLNSPSTDTFSSPRSSPDQEKMNISNASSEPSSLDCQQQEFVPRETDDTRLPSNANYLPLRNFSHTNTHAGVNIQPHSSLPSNINRIRNKPKKNMENTANGTYKNSPLERGEAATVEKFKISNPCNQFVSQVKSRVQATKCRGKNMFQDCLVITNHSIYILRLDQDPVTLFIESAMQGDVKTSERLAATFELDSKSLMELAADIKLSEGDFGGAIALYRLSGCKHLKAVLKFAASGHVHELLSYLSVLFKTPNLDVSNSDRIHLSNLTLMAYFQQALSDNYGTIGATILSSPSSAATKREEFRARICNFLDENRWIDETLAIKLGTEVREWALLDRFCENRGLERQLMQVVTAIFKTELTSFSATENSVKRPQDFRGEPSKFVYSTMAFKTLQDVTTKMISDMPTNERRSLLNCLVKPGNLLACITEPELGVDLLNILFGALPFCDENQLECIVAQTEPSQDAFRPVLLQLMVLKSSRYVMNSNEVSIFSDFLSSQGQNEPTIKSSGYRLIQLMLNFYITAQLLLIKKYVRKLMNINGPSSSKKATDTGENMIKDLYNNTSKAETTCDANLVKTLFNHAFLDQNPFVNNALLRQSLDDSETSPGADILEKVCKTRVIVEPSIAQPIKGFKLIEKPLDYKYQNVIMKSSFALLAAGPNHVLLKRPRTNLLISWGSTEYGALGHAQPKSTSSRYSPPNDVAFFTRLNEVYTITKKDARNENDEYGCNEELFKDCFEETEFERKTIDCNLRNVPSPITVFGAACGKMHTLALTDRGVYAWGSSTYGQLGLGFERRMTKQPEMIVKLSKYTVTSIACGHYHSLALDYKSRLWAWGWGAHGQLGLGDIEDEYAPKRVRYPQQLFEEVICRIAAGYAHTMISTLAGSVWVFGCGLFGQLANGDNKKSTFPIKVSFTNVINSTSLTTNDRLVGVIACGYFHNLAVSQDGQRLYTWGCNPQLLRQEAQQKKKERLQNILSGKGKCTLSEMVESEPDSLPSKKLLKENNEVMAGGDKESVTVTKEMSSQMSNSPTSYQEQKSSSKEKEDKECDMLHLIPSLLDTAIIKGDIVDVACGNQHSMVLSSTGLVYSYGRNSEGQLGIGTRSREVKALTLITALADDFVIEIASGGDYSAALCESGTVFCWGHNSCGQLGKPPMEDQQGGKTEITGSKGKVVLLKTSRLNYKITKLQHSTNYGILQNSCDIPKPILGLNSGVYSNEGIDTEMAQQEVIKAIERLKNCNRHFKLIKPKKSLMLDKLTSSRLTLHSCIETFYAHLEHTKLIKKCLVSDNPQAAAKLSLLSNSQDSILQAFEFTLQAIVKQFPTISTASLSKQVFDAFNFYLHFTKSKLHRKEPNNTRIQEKRQLTERLIACWQDQKFSFVQLESLFLQKSDTLLFQALVLTLFCPDDERETDDGPLLSSPANITSPKLVDLFTPGFCLNVGDIFVKNMMEEDPDEGFISGNSKGGAEYGIVANSKSLYQTNNLACGRRRKMVVSRWLERQRSKDVEKDDTNTHSVQSQNLEEFLQGSQMEDNENCPASLSSIGDSLGFLQSEVRSLDLVAKDPLAEGYALKDLVNDLISEDNE